MNTLTIDPVLLQQVEDYAKTQNKSLTEYVEDLFRRIVPKVEEETEDEEYDISPTFRAWEKEWQCPVDIGDDYKAMWHEHLAEKYS